MTDFSFNVICIPCWMSHKIVSFKNLLTKSHSHKRCSIALSLLLQNVHFGSSMSFILYNKVFVAKILWLILLWNHWTVLSLVILNGPENIFPHSSSSNLYCWFQEIFPAGMSVVLFSRLYMSCAPFLLFEIFLDWKRYNRVYLFMPYVS